MRHGAAVGGARLRKLGRAVPEALPNARLYFPKERLRRSTAGESAFHTGAVTFPGTSPPPAQETHTPTKGGIMNPAASSIRRRSASGRALCLLLGLAACLLLAGPAQATVQTVFTCPSSGDEGNHDNIFNGFYVQHLAATNIHSVQVYYTTDTSGTYEISLTATVGTATGAQIGNTLTQSVALVNGSDTPVTWTFNDPAFPSGQTIYFTHNTLSGPGD